MNMPYEQMSILKSLQKAGETELLEEIISDTIIDIIKRNKNNPNNQFMINRYVHLLYGYGLIVSLTSFERIVELKPFYDSIIIKLLNKDHHELVMKYLERKFKQEHDWLSREHYNKYNEFVHMYDKPIE